jgi:hypothetical protein
MAAPKKNKNAEKWTYEEAIKVFDAAVELAKTGTYDFLGEIAREQDLYLEIYDYLTDKFTDLKPYQTKLKRLCEANCFSNGKTGKIVASLAIMNLKSNHAWTDRNDVTSGGETVKSITGIEVK